GQGGELELRFSATDSWLLGLNIGYLNTVVESYKTQDSSGNEVDIASSTEIGFSPNWNARLSSQYAVDIADYGTLTAAADVSWRSESYTNSPVDKRDQFADEQKQEDHHLVNAALAFETQDRKWRVAVEGKNLEDKRVLTNSFVVGPFVSGGYNSPRTWAVSLNYRY
uniref:TonB-dependent receptor domain-containing protein n=1 Tax=Spongiibacter sp. TaxID=2024860 RepID=UPI00356536DB